MMERLQQRRWFRSVAIGSLLLTTIDAAHAYSLWSTASSYQQTGTLYLGGEAGPLGDLTIERLLLVGPTEWFVPFNNNGVLAPNACAGVRADTDAPINENIRSCPTSVAGVDVNLSIVDGGPHHGQLMGTMSVNGILTISADVALQKNTEALIRIPLYATTGVVPVAPGLRGHVDSIARRFPWMKVAPNEIRGRVGDFNKDGWIDGTLIATGILTDGSPLHAGQPYLIIRHFDTNMPASGVLSGDVKALQGTLAR